MERQSLDFSGAVLGVAISQPRAQNSLGLKEFKKSRKGWACFGGQEAWLFGKAR